MRLSSIRGRVFSLVALCVAPFVGAAVLAVTREGARSVDDVRRQSLASAQLAAREMDVAFRGLAEVMDSAMHAAGRPGSNTLSAREILQLGGPMLDALELAIVRPDGRIVASVSPATERLQRIADLRRAALARKAMDAAASANMVDEGIDGVRADTSGLIVLRGLRARPGCRCPLEQAGALIAYVPGRDVRRVLSEDSLPDGSIALLLGASGAPVIPPSHSTRWLGRTAGDSVLRGTLSDRSSALLLSGTDGVTRTYAFHRLSLLPWQAYVGIPIDDGGGGGRRTLFWTLGLASLVLTGAWFAAARVQRRILRPLRQLAGDMVHVADGDLDHRSVVSKIGGDVGALGHAFNSMAAQVSQRTDSLESLLSREEQLIDRSPVAIWLFDSMPSGGNRVRRANAAAGRLVGRTARSMIGLRDTDLFDATVSGVMAHVASPHEDAAQTIEAPMPHAGGALQPCALVIGKVPQSHVTALLVAAVPIPTQNGRAPGAQRLAAESPAAVAQDAVARVTGRVGTDLEQAVTSVLGYADVARAHADDPEMVSIAAREIQTVARRLSVVARQLRVMGRRQPLSIEREDVRTIIERAVTSSERHLGARVTLELAIQDTPMPTLADAAQCELALMALIMNARDTMPEGGVVRVRADLLADGEHDHLPSTLVAGHYICVSVGDSGPGIAEPIRARLYEPFTTSKPDGEGAGLGLAMVHGVVHQHGWTIVHADDVEGTTFRIYLPLITRAATLESPVATVLLVEPTATRAATLQQQFAEAGYRVLTATSARHAHERRADHAGVIDVLCVSEWLPDGSGDLLAESLTAEAPGTAVVVLAHSAQEDGASTAHTVIDAVSSPSEVLAAVDQALATSRTAFTSVAPLSDDELDALMLSDTDAPSAKE